MPYPHSPQVAAVREYFLNLTESCAIITDWITIVCPVAVQRRCQLISASSGGHCAPITRVRFQ